MKLRGARNVFDGRSGERMLFVVSALSVHGILSACGGLFEETSAQNAMRIRDYVQSTSDGLRSSSGYVFWDSEYNLKCTFQPVRDGSTRCLPTAFAATDYYADESCTEPVAAISISQCDSVPSYAKVAEHVEGACPESVYSVIELGRRHEGDIFTSLDGSCMVEDAPPPLSFFLVARDTADSEWIEGEFGPDI